MRDIYLIDFENVASEGLSGITYLSEEDQVIIFYSNNSNRLTMKMHILIGKSVCKLDYFEVTVGGKNALDHQIATWLGYLIGTGAAERNYYIVSKDMGYKHVANFWAANKIGPRVRCVDTIKSASRIERNRRENREQVLHAVPQEPAAEVKPVEPEQPVEAVPVEEVQIIAVPESLTAEAQIPQETPETAPVESRTEETATTPACENTEPVQEEPETAEPAVVLTVLPAESEDGEENAAGENVGTGVSPRKNYRNRTRVRRTRSKSRDGAESGEERPKTAEVPVTAQEPEKQAEPRKPEAKTENRPVRKERQPDMKQAPVMDQLAVMIAPYPKLQENVLRELIAGNKRQVLCNTLRKHLGQEKGLALYNEIKRAAWH